MCWCCVNVTSECDMPRTGLIAGLATIAGMTLLSACSNSDLTARNAPFPNQHSERSVKALSAKFIGGVPTVIHFRFDRDDLDDSAAEIIAAQAAWIMSNPNVVFSVSGHADRVGSLVYNQDLGLRRAQRVVDHMIGLGVPEQQLLAILSAKLKK